MSKLKARQIAALEKELKTGETIEVTGEFRALSSICPFFAVAALSFVAGRIFTSQLFVLLLTNLLSVWMMADAARALVTAQNSCVLVTNRRIYGLAGQKRFCLTHHQIHQIHERGGLFLDAGEARSSVMLRYLSNQQAVKTALEQHRRC